MDSNWLVPVEEDALSKKLILVVSALLKKNSSSFTSVENFCYLQQLAAQNT